MKNILWIGIDKIDVLPINTLYYRLQTKHKRERRWRGRGPMHTVDGVWPYEIARRIIKKYIGKQWDKAYSEYCSKVPWYQKNVFKEEFRDKNYRYSTSYIVDKNGCIQYSRMDKRKKDLCIKSDDFKIELRHRWTGHKKDDFLPVYKQEPYISRFKTFKMSGMRNSRLLYYEYGAIPGRMKPLYERYRSKESEFEAVIVSGWIKYFKNKKDPEFKRLIAEKRKQRLINTKKQQILLQEKAYDMMTKREAELKKEKAANDVKILAHGFDLETSFRGQRHNV